MQFIWVNFNLAACICTLVKFLILILFLLFVNYIWRDSVLSKVILSLCLIFTVVGYSVKTKHSREWCLKKKKKKPSLLVCGVFVCLWWFSISFQSSSSNFIYLNPANWKVNDLYCLFIFRYSYSILSRKL